MKVISSEELRVLIRFAVDLEAQTTEDRLTLTLQEIHQVVGEARIDRYPDMVDNARRIKRPAKKMIDAKAGHWDLVQGVYWVTYNETVSIPEGSMLFLENHPSLAENGVMQTSRSVLSWDEVSGTLLTVGARGVRLTEGAPISVGRMVRF